MSLLDLFFAVAVPFTIVCVVVAGVVRSYAARKGIYDGEEGAARRDAINQNFRTNTGAVVIAVIFFALWGLMVAGLVEQWGAILFTFVVSALLLIPFFTVCLGVIMVYMFAVHAYVKLRDG